MFLVNNRQKPLSASGVANVSGLLVLANLLV